MVVAENVKCEGKSCADSDSASRSPYET
ncbi:TPA: hypothetical protein ACFRHF_002235 [Neisseria lactamica]